MRKPSVAEPVPISADHDFSGFDCGEAALNDWLKQRALKNENRFSRTFVVCEKNKVAGYYSILAGSVERGLAPGKIRRNAPEVIPVSILGRLAVDRSYCGKGLGADLLFDALRRIALTSQTIGMGAVLIHAKDESAKRFYLKWVEFIEYPLSSRTLFLPIETIMEAMSG